MNITTATNDFGDDSLVIFGCFTGVMIILLNILCIYLVKTSRTIASQIKTLLLNISSIDLQFGIIIMIPSLTQEFTEPKWILNVGKLISVTSYFFTMVISIDRMISVWHPNFYILHGTEERITKISRMIWIAYFVLMVLLLICLSLGLRFTEIVMDIFSIILYLTTTFCVVFSACILYKHNKRQLEALCIYRLQNSRMSVLKNYKTTIVLLLICMSLVLFSFPAVLVVMIRVTNHHLYQNFDKFKSVARRMSVLNHFVNIFLYCLRFKECRQRLFRMCGRKHNEVGVEHPHVRSNIRTLSSQVDREESIKL